MKPFLKMEFSSFSIKKTMLLLPTLFISLNSGIALAEESGSTKSHTVSSINTDNSKIKTDARNRANNEKLENQLELFLDGKIKGNSLVLLREPAPDFDANGNAIYKPLTEQTDRASLARIKIPAKSAITGISCNGLREFFKNEGLITDTSDINQIEITQKSIVEYFNASEIKNHFSERTRTILLKDFQDQLKHALEKRRIPQACFADIVEPSGEKHTVYLTHKHVQTQTSDYSPEYELIDFTYDQKYLSLESKPEAKEQK